MNIDYKIKNLDEEAEYGKTSFTNFDFVLNELRLGKDIFESHVQIDRNYFIGQFVENEKNVLFNIIQWLKPRKIIEFSPSHGYTTTLTAAAAGEFETFETYEINPDCVKKTKEHLQATGFGRVEVIEGNVFDKMDLEKLKQCDFLFVDADHSKEFTEKYVNSFFTLLKKGAWVAIHDCVFDPEPNDETQVVVDWLNKNNLKKYFYVRDLANYFRVNDKNANPYNAADTEQSTTLWFKNE